MKQVGIEWVTVNDVSCSTTEVANVPGGALVKVAESRWMDAELPPTQHDVALTFVAGLKVHRDGTLTRMIVEG